MKKVLNLYYNNSFDLSYLSLHNVNSHLPSSLFWLINQDIYQNYYHFFADVLISIIFLYHVKSCFLSRVFLNFVFYKTPFYIYHYLRFCVNFLLY